MIRVQPTAGTRCGKLSISWETATMIEPLLARRLKALGLYWREIAVRDSDALTLIGSGSRTPTTSLEPLDGVAEHRPCLSRRTVDTTIVDPLRNGDEPLRIASLADAFATHVAPHNPVGEPGKLMAAHFCAAMPKLHRRGLGHDEAPWSRGVVTPPATVVGGERHIPDAPGWGRRGQPRGAPRISAARRLNREE
jgi:L-alanine-DL-glutamate epimerase-like enolase superfamily enzyme